VRQHEGVMDSCHRPPALVAPGVRRVRVQKALSKFGTRVRQSGKAG
jgi:hypothetical protein